MREDGKRLRCLGFAAIFMLATSAADAQVHQFSAGQRNLACGSPASLNDGWPTATPESVGLDDLRLCGIAARLAAANANVHAVVIARHGQLVFEQYFAGYDQLWGTDRGPFEFDATTKHDMRSVSKSVTSLLVGIAIDRELIKSVDTDRQILSGLLGAENGRLGQHHPSSPPDHVVGHAMGSEPPLGRSAK
jgi:CubicO group peptidase (beta-lactamase class C family)